MADVSEIMMKRATATMRGAIVPTQRGLAMSTTICSERLRESDDTECRCWRGAQRRGPDGKGGHSPTHGLEGKAGKVELATGEQVTTDISVEGGHTWSHGMLTGNRGPDILQRCLEEAYKEIQPSNDHSSRSSCTCWKLAVLEKWSEMSTIALRNKEMKGREWR